MGYCHPFVCIILFNMLGYDVLFVYFFFNLFFFLFIAVSRCTHEYPHTVYNLTLNQLLFPLAQFSLETRRG